ncbi:MAG: hypothetical protein QXU92_03725 [Candidatus Diapherotrites archaeon]
MNILRKIELKYKLNNCVKIAKGWTSEVFVCYLGDKKVAMKLLRQKSNRKNMVLRECENLALANSVGVGPKLFFSDYELGFVCMEYISGVKFCDWLCSCNNKLVLMGFIKELFRQAKELDRIGLDHGQLAGAGKNIIVRDNLPVIIDFEKASTKRKVHNLKVLESFLFKSKNSSITKKVLELCNPRDFME